MKLNPPKNVTFIISIVLAVAGIVGLALKIAILPWALAVGFVLLAVALLVKGL